MERRAVAAGAAAFEAKVAGRFAPKKYQAPPAIRMSNAAIPAASGVSAEGTFGAAGRTAVAGFACAGTPTCSE
jgi:hypothetical protein